MASFSSGENAAFAADQASAAKATRSIFSLLDRVSLINPFDTRGIIPEKCTGRIEFRNVYFAYPRRPDVMVLKVLVNSSTNQSIGQSTNVAPS